MTRFPQGAYVLDLYGGINDGFTIRQGAAPEETIAFIVRDYKAVILRPGEPRLEQTGVSYVEYTFFAIDEGGHYRYVESQMLENVKDKETGLWFG